jgi:hypothetical protein
MNSVDQTNLFLGLHDFTPVLLSAIALFFFSRLARSAHADAGRMALLGAIFVLIGGGGKALWKTLYAASSGGIDIRPLDLGPFLWMGTGFVLVAYALSYTRRILSGGQPRRANLWLMPLISAGVFLLVSLVLSQVLAGSRVWYFLGIGWTAAGQISSSIVAILMARAAGLKTPAIVFAVAILLMLAMSGLASGQRTLTTQWTQQIVNMCSNAAYAWAAWSLGKAYLDGNARVRQAVPTA